jgi:hypothetical protein
VDKETLGRIGQEVLARMASGDKNLLDADVKVDVSEVFFDSTCLKANIHFPVDWVLLRDAARTLLKAVVLIRRDCGKRRMPESPERFMGRMNKLSMAMSAALRKKDGKKAAKKVLRSMKKLEAAIAGHARSHRQLLAGNPGRMSAGRAAVVLKRIDAVLEALPLAIKQAHERIIGARPLPDAQKLHSLYESEVEVVIRGKTGAQVEFGNMMFVAENQQAFIVHHELFEDKQADTKVLIPAAKKLKKRFPQLKRIWTDRGFFSADNERKLKREKIKSGLCPRDPCELQRRLEQDEGMADGLRRRAGTEARIAILKNGFTGNPCRAKGLEHRRLAVSWSVLAHNIWRLARLNIQAAKDREKTGLAQAA